MKRVAGVKGKFYPSDCHKIEKMIDEYNTILNKYLKDKGLLKRVPRAVIVPHAGYIYSGFTANFAYRLLKNSDAKRVIVIGPSHHVYINGISGSISDIYETPCKDIVIDREYLNLLKTKYPIEYVLKAHQVEHSTETQMPFIAHYLPKAKIVELIYSKIDYKKLSNMINTILQDNSNVVVISSDLSHFYSLKNAKELDNICLNAILKEDINILEKGCQACGKLGIKAMLESAKKLKLKSEILDYRTSADRSGDESSVVGYTSAIFYN